MKKMLLLADDFTGANDSGIKIVKRGYPANINLDSSMEDNSQMLIIDSETRNIDESESYAKVEEFTKSIKGLSEYLVIYKKIDSTLRGNIKSEYEAFAKYVKPKYTIFAPAHPDLGRTTKGGVHFVDGTRIMDSEFSEDPLKPVNNDDIKTILGGNVNHHSVEEIRDNLLIKPGINTFDCEIFSDLEEISKKALELDERVLFMGSAGLCDAIFDQLIIKKPALAIVGSVSNQNRKSIDYCKDVGIPIVSISLLDYNNDSYKAKIKTVTDLLIEGKDVVISTSKDRQDYLNTKKYLIEKGLDPDKVMSDLFEYISDKIIKKSEISGLFTTGGTTSIELLKSIGASGTKLIDEIEDGVIMSEIQGIDKELYLVTKAGAFGNEKTIYNSLNEIRRISK
ncbi:four-carbon acid sugar kinase family protein [uncultured Anaerococcus sp.]|uniref:four-carbon acid sugar kinase family protein n=1 Tax=uncultured Anaerococcus sp. TaxID=293428 RepID=UPI0026338575|nr:four-carbon acid sugar kinase family protein [uncultured Anaerococcus sp.]